MVYVVLRPTPGRYESVVRKALLGKTKPGAALAAVVPWGEVRYYLPGGLSARRKRNGQNGSSTANERAKYCPHRADELSIHAILFHNP